MTSVTLTIKARSYSEEYGVKASIQEFSGVLHQPITTHKERQTK
jgi:HSP90 family molecular chaperone